MAIPGVFSHDGDRNIDRKYIPSVRKVSGFGTERGMDTAEPTSVHCSNTVLSGAVTGHCLQ